MTTNIFEHVKKALGEPISPGKGKNVPPIVIEFNKVVFTQFEYKNDMKNGILFYTENADEEENTGIFRTSSSVVYKQMKDVCEAIGIQDKEDVNVFHFRETVMGKFASRSGRDGDYITLVE